MFIYERPVLRASDYPLLSFLIPRFADLLFVALLAGVLGLGPRLLNVDGDLGRHLTIGSYILESFSIPRQDLFSHTLAGESLAPHEWLSQVFFALAYRMSGLDGTVLLSAILIAGTFSLVYRQSVGQSRSPSLSLILSLLAAAAASLHWLARPHLFTLILVSLWTGELERIRTSDKPRVWFFPALMLFWANLHGAFVAGFALLSIYLAGELVEWFGGRAASGKRVRLPGKPGVGGQARIRSLIAAGIGSALASLANPAGWHLWETSLGFLRNRYLVGHTAEYLPPDFHAPAAWPFLLMIVLSILLLGAGRRLGATPSTMLAAWTAMGLYSVRNVPLYAVTAAPILAASASAWLHEQPTLAFWKRFDERLEGVEASLRGHLWPVIAILVAALAFANGLRLDITGKGNRFDPGVFPVAAVDWLESQSPPGNVFNHFPWGGYLLYRMWPEEHVFIDGQTDFYGETITRKYEQVIGLGEGWQEVLHRYDVGWVLVPAGSSLAKVLSTEPGWGEVYRDGTAAIFFSSHEGEP